MSWHERCKMRRQTSMVSLAPALSTNMNACKHTPPPNVTSINSNAVLRQKKTWMSWLSTTLVACVSIVALHSCVAHLLSYDNRWRNKETLKTMRLGTHAVSHLEPFDPSSRVMNANPELNPSLIQCRHVKANESTRVFRCVAMVGSVATELLLHVFSKGYSPRPLHGKYTNPIEPRSQHSHLVHSCRYGRLVALLGKDHCKNCCCCCCCCCCCLFYPHKVAIIAWPPNIWKNSVAFVAPTICQWLSLVVDITRKIFAARNHA